jgi:hypothetical protein
MNQKGDGAQHQQARNAFDIQGGMIHFSMDTKEYIRKCRLLEVERGGKGQQLVSRKNGLLRLRPG